MIIVCLVMLVSFLIKISPENNKYVAAAYQKLFNKQPTVNDAGTTQVPITQRPDSTLTDDEKKQKTAQLYLDSINMALLELKQKRSAVTLMSMSLASFKEKPLLPKDSIHTPTFQHKNDTNAIQKTLLQFVEKHHVEVPISSGLVVQPRLPGKLIALQQTARFFKEHPAKIVTGTGIGNFSSKLAFRATSMKVTGSYPEKFTYISNDFRSNHLDLYLYYFTSKDDYHSIANSPNSTYDQLLSEYGLVGLAAFAFFYIGFFVKQLRFSAYGIPLLLFMMGIFFFDYWFEQLSVVVFFELLLLLNIKELKPDHGYSRT